MLARVVGVWLGPAMSAVTGPQALKEVEEEAKQKERERLYHDFTPLNWMDRLFMLD